MRGCSKFNQLGTCPLVTINIFRTHGAYCSTERNEYLSSLLSAKRFLDKSSSKVLKESVNGLHIYVTGKSFVTLLFIKNLFLRLNSFKLTAYLLSTKWMIPICSLWWRSMDVMEFGNFDSTAFLMTSLLISLVTSYIIRDPAILR